MEFPIDVLYPYHLVKREAGIKVCHKTLEVMINLSLKFQVGNTSTERFCTGRISFKLSSP